MAVFKQFKASKKVTKWFQKKSQNAFQKNQKKLSKEVTKGGHCDPYLHDHLRIKVV
jgi:hypothetical protein